MVRTQEITVSDGTGVLRDLKGLGAAYATLGLLCAMAFAGNVVCSGQRTP